LLYLKHAFNESNQGVEVFLLETAHAKLVQAAKEAGVPLKPRNRSWTRPSVPPWGGLARRDDAAG